LQCRGIHVFLVVGKKDLDYGLQQANAADQSGKINMAKPLPALAVWEDLAALHVQEKVYDIVNFNKGVVADF